MQAALQQKPWITQTFFYLSSCVHFLRPWGYGVSVRFMKVSKQNLSNRNLQNDVPIQKETLIARLNRVYTRLMSWIFRIFDGSFRLDRRRRNTAIDSSLFLLCDLHRSNFRMRTTRKQCVRQARDERNWISQEVLSGGKGWSLQQFSLNKWWETSCMFFS